MKQGTTPTKKIKIGVDPALVESIIFTIKSGKHLLHKRYPEDVKFESGYYLLNLTQKETERLHYVCLLEAQINLIGGAVAKTTTEKFCVDESLYTEIKGNRAGGIVEGEIPLISSDVIVVSARESPIYASDIIGLDTFIPAPMTAQELRRILEF